ncbi:MAG: FG-GAP repeat protein [Planctomycetaceae bacterium]|nr:FG-GAP repeat protein [Planctomycetaceae bacterium]
MLKRLKTVESLNWCESESAQEVAEFFRGASSGFDRCVQLSHHPGDHPTHTAIREVKSVRPDVLGGVNVAVGDLTGDGFNELVIASRNAGQSWVDIYTLAPQNVSEHVAGFQAFGPTEGNNVAVNLVVRDTDGDGLAEIIVTQGARGKAGFVARKFQVKSSLETKIVDEIFAEWSNPLATGLFIG